jgi:N-acetylglutamate synthase-like GNAT family acetyltransferase
VRAAPNVIDGVEIRRELRPGDLGAIVAHHGQLYAREYGVNSEFEAMVAGAVAQVQRAGFPTEREAIWIVERNGEHAGSIALTDDGDAGVVRWVLLDSELRGRGLGGRLLAELLAKARKLEYKRLWLETFSDLTAAARLYREAGFELTWEDTKPRWGRTSITYQHYELELARARGLTKTSVPAGR